MDLDIAKKIIKKYAESHSGFIKRAIIAERYYKKDNDILYSDKREDTDDPLHTADNRIPSNFYKLQVNQKAAYAFTEPVMFDAGSDDNNNLIKTALGDSFQKKCKALSVQSSNSSIGWVHYWKNKEGKFKYAVVDSKQIIPVWTKDLEKDLLAVLRMYLDVDEDTGEEYEIYEYWTDKEAQSFRRKVDSSWETLEFYNQYRVIDIDTGMEEFQSTYRHDFGEVPFIFFKNNDEEQNDLKDIKELIDAYDKVYSGFVNDMEDIQEIIFIITNYGGEAESPIEILKEMKDAKIINVESEGSDDKSGISTLAIEIPVEAREKLLTITRKAIFEQGMAIDPDPQNFGNSSGVALGYLYSLLELKTGLMETEFRVSFNRLIRAILKFHGRSADTIEQTWTRTRVSNDAELAEIASKSKGVVSDETIVQNHPWTVDATKEMERLNKQKEKEAPDWDKVPPVKDGDGDGKE